MTVEIKQLVIKSTLVGDRKEKFSAEAIKPNLDTVKQEIIDECRELVERILAEKQER